MTATRPLFSGFVLSSLLVVSVPALAQSAQAPGGDGSAKAVLAPPSPSPSGVQPAASPGAASGEQPAASPGPQSGYHGLTPEALDAIQAAVQRAAGQPLVHWVGLETTREHTRLFAVVSGSVEPAVYKPDPEHLVVEFPGAGIADHRLRLPLYAQHLGGPVERVLTEIVRGSEWSGVRLEVSLSTPVDYTVHKDGPLLVVDMPTTLR